MTSKFKWANADGSEFWASNFDLKVSSVPVESLVSKLEIQLNVTDKPVPSYLTSIVQDVIIGDREWRSVSQEQFDTFLLRFGPLDECIRNVGCNLYDQDGIIQPFLHTGVSTDEATSKVSKSGEGAYLFRFSNSKKDAIVLTFLHSGTVNHRYVFPVKSGGWSYLQDAKSKDFATLEELTRASSKCGHYVKSAIFNIMSGETEPTPNPYYSMPPSFKRPTSKPDGKSVDTVKMKMEKGSSRSKLVDAALTREKSMVDRDREDSKGDRPSLPKSSSVKTSDRPSLAKDKSTFKGIDRADKKVKEKPKPADDDDDPYSTVKKKPAAAPKDKEDEDDAYAVTGGKKKPAPAPKEEEEEDNAYSTIT